MPIVDDLQQIASLLRGERCQSPVIITPRVGETHGGDEWKRTENLRHGLTPDAAASRQNLIAPVLVIQPVTTLEALEMDKRNDRAPAVLDHDDSGET